MELLRSDAVMLLGDRVLTVVLLKGTIFLAVLLTALLCVRGGRVTARAGVGVAAGFGLLLLVVVGWQKPLAQAALVAFPRTLFDDGFAAPVVAAMGPLAAGPGQRALEALSALPGISWLAVLWAVGCAFVVGRFLRDRLRIGRIARGAPTVTDARVVWLAARITDRLGIRRSVRLRRTELVPAALTFGVLEPVILLPADAGDWSDDRLVSVLYHELAHVRRHDYVALLGMELALALYWLNPLVWILARELRRSQDLACDAVALRSGVRSSAYAGFLLDSARSQLARSRAAGALPFSHRSGLRRRIDAVLDGQLDQGRRRLRPLVLALSAVLLSAAASLAATDLWDCTATTAAAAPISDALPTHL